MLPRLAAVLLLATAFAAPAAGAPGTIAVGVGADAPRAELAAALTQESGGRLVEDLGPLDALVFAVPDVRAALAAARTHEGVEYAEPVPAASRRLAFEPNDPLYPEQWYLPVVRAFSFEPWVTKPPHAPVRVAVVDSGLDGSHPDFAGRIAAAKSFVGGSALADSFGHGTVVAGLAAAGVDDETGIAGAGVQVELLVAKVVDEKGRISVLNEARAIRWAVNNGAKVINLSLGGPRDPTNPRRDSYSALEHAAVDYATRRGVLVVAAAGNCARFRCPEPYASWPAALPHVLGVGALRPDGQTPSFSNRDRLHVDLAAPGTQMHSTYPAKLGASGCTPAGYTFCAARLSDRNPRGTSFAAPLVAGAAASLLGERGLAGPGARLHASQVRTILERSAADVPPLGRDKRSGFGRLDVESALGRLGRPLPPRDRYEPNDDAGARSFLLRGGAIRIRATVDPFDDRRDVYRIGLRKGQRVEIHLNGPHRGNSNLFLWRPGTPTLDTGARALRANLLAKSTSPSWTERIVVRARQRGNHFVEVRLPRGKAGQYTLTITKSP